MEWKIYLRHKEKSYRILKLTQGANLDIFIIPKNAIYFSREIIQGLDLDEQIQLKYEYLGGKIDHYSAHSLTGQRHIKLEPGSPALEPTIGLNFKNIDRPIPLVTMVATANVGSQEEPGSGKWFGLNLPEDTNYLIMDMIATPKNSHLGFQQNFTISNDKKTRETFDSIPIEMRNCTITLLIRTTNHELTDVPNNVLFSQAEGKTVTIVRVEKGMVLAQVAKLEVR
jgi:hypothetical protein